MLPPDLSPEKFLADFWQKRPLVIRNALPDFQDPLSPEELAGLACEEEVESRLVFSEKDTWRLQQGPFSESAFLALPESGWTLLVQAVDQWLPGVKQLLEHIDFIPDWRLDDVMASYATEQAGIGPHFDYYDVIIVQGQGERLWQLGQSCSSSDLLRSETDLAILQDFRVTEEYTLQCGDVLYIPPGTAHQGTSMKNSISYSIGFRAPSYTDIISQFAADICAELTEDQRYSDAGLGLQENNAEIDKNSIQRLKVILANSLLDEDAIQKWFGRFMTQRKYPELQYFPEPELMPEQFKKKLAKIISLDKHPAARFAYIQQQEKLLFFADGEIFSFDPENPSCVTLAKTLCDKQNQTIPIQPFANQQDCITLLCKLYNQGTLIESEEHA